MTGIGRSIKARPKSDASPAMRPLRAPHAATVAVYDAPGGKLMCRSFSHQKPVNCCARASGPF